MVLEPYEERQMMVNKEERCFNCGSTDLKKHSDTTYTCNSCNQWWQIPENMSLSSKINPKRKPSKDWVVDSVSLSQVFASITDNEATGFVVDWAAHDGEGNRCGFGQLTLRYKLHGEEGKFEIDTETLSREFARKVLVKMIDEAEIIGLSEREEETQKP
jgi:hypothetical protein